MNGRPRTAKMPNPSIAIAVGSYAGSMNIGDTFISFRKIVTTVFRMRSLSIPNLGYAAAKDMRTLRLSGAAKSRFTPDRRP